MKAVKSLSALLLPLWDYLDTFSMYLNDLMAKTKQITGHTTDELWQQVTADLSGKEVYEYDVALEQDGRRIMLDIDIDLGGGFEGGYATTRFMAPVSPVHDFRFAVHHQELVDSAGKFFGMEDVVIGYPEFDEALIVRTNDRERTRRIFADPEVRKLFASLRYFTLHITHHHVSDQKEKLPFLELMIEDGITDPVVLRGLYEGFCKVLEGVEKG